MKTKKIKMEQYYEISKYNPVAKKLRPICEYYLNYDENSWDYVIEIRLPFRYWLPMLVPGFFIQLGYCLWDGGLKEFDFCDLSRYLHSSVINKFETEAFKKCEEIFYGKQ